MSAYAFLTSRFGMVTSKMPFPDATALIYPVMAMME